MVIQVSRWHCNPHPHPLWSTYWHSFCASQYIRASFTFSHLAHLPIDFSCHSEDLTNRWSIHPSYLKPVHMLQQQFNFTPSEFAQWIFAWAILSAWAESAFATRSVTNGDFAQGTRLAASTSCLWYYFYCHCHCHCSLFFFPLERNLCKLLLRVTALVTPYSILHTPSTIHHPPFTIPLYPLPSILYPPSSILKPICLHCHKTHIHTHTKMSPRHSNKIFSS